MRSEKIWYTRIQGLVEGPYSVSQLAEDPRFTPSTLVWREGFREWIPAGQVAEFDQLFEKRDSDEPKALSGGTLQARITPDGLAIDRRAPPPHMVWIFILLGLLTYLLIHLFSS